MNEIPCRTKKNMLWDREGGWKSRFVMGNVLYSRYNHEYLYSVGRVVRKGGLVNRENWYQQFDVYIYDT
mgnify:CR=1 FL=1